jgi:HAD superfamily hydrolase (TIGR01509 family)
MPDRGFFADLDGTLADSLLVLRDAYRGFMARVGRPDSDAEFELLKGPPVPAIVAQLRASHGLEQSASELERIYRELVDEAYRSVDPMPHAAEVLAAAGRAGWVVGVVTSNGALRTRAWLERTRLSASIDLVISGEDVSRGKPDPEPYRQAIARAGCDPAQSIAVEDSLQGAAAARAAGLAIFLLGPHQGSAASQPGVCAIGSLAELLPVLATPRRRHKAS